MPNETGPETTPTTPTAHHTHVAPILAILILVLIVILGGLYLWGSMLKEASTQNPTERSIPNNEPETPRANTDREIMDTTSSSDELDMISADLESTNLEDLDTELGTVETEMDASLE